MGEMNDKSIILRLTLVLYDLKSYSGNCYFVDGDVMLIPQPCHIG